MLPKLPYKGIRREKEIVAFLGLNRTETGQEGELRNATNMTTAEYPTLTQRQKRGVVIQYPTPADIAEWDGHLITVGDGTLCYDWQPLCSVIDGPKQYAVVNTKMVIYPDQIVVDLKNGTATPMAASVTNTGMAYLGENYLEFEPESVYTKQTKRFRNDRWPEEELEPWMWVWDSVEWHGDTQTWTVGNAYLVSLFSPTTEAENRFFIPGVSTSQLDGSYVIAPPSHVVWSETAPDPLEFLPPTPDNFLGFYSQLNEYEQGVLDGTSRYADWIITTRLAAQENHTDLTTVFEVGDAVTIKDTFLGIADGEHVRISDVTPTRITFDTEFIIPYWTLHIDENIIVDAEHPGNAPLISWEESDSTWRTVSLAADETYILHEGNYIFYRQTEDGQEILEWDQIRRKVVQTISIGAPTQAHTGTYQAWLFYDTIKNPFTISRDVPALDFICAHENRLWGISNSVENRVWNEKTGRWDSFTSRVIYASALGEPTHFWDFAGVDTDSYQVAVGSEDDFTALCSYGGSVCCWKEHEMIRVLGAFPSEFYTVDYKIEGVAAGSHRSLVNVNETLYYAGTSGVYSFRATRPVEIGAVLNGTPKNAVGGSDGHRWYLSGIVNGSPELVVYDLDRKLWMREDNTRAEAFAMLDNVLNFLSSGIIYQTMQGPDPDLEWSVELVPFDETKVIRKRYIHLALRLDMTPGSKVTVQVSYDNSGEWKTLLDEDTKVDVAKRIAFTPKRCDRMRIRISGTGVVKLRDLTREYYPGSERV